jgi:aminomuconate-semialdehyde/2-hydroxymuconate-6-semialdehyde dehydrogenase
MSNTLPEFPLFIDGKFVKSETGETFPNINPATGQVIGKIALANESDVDKAVVSAQKAFHQIWKKTSLQERIDFLHKIANAIQNHFDDFLKTEIADTGKPIALARTLDVPRAIANFKNFAALAYSLSNESYETFTEDGKGCLNYTVRKPLGVVGVICPWNLPLLLLTWKVAPALAAGNTVVVKPSSETPATATLLAHIMQEVGLPPGVYNVVHGDGSVVGNALVHHPEVAGITFTGESKTGQAIMKEAASGLKLLSFELGGKNPAIIFKDCPFEKTIEGMTRAVFANTGQVCLCAERVYVEKTVFEKFVEEFKKSAENLVLGDPMDPKTTTGPLISIKQREKVLGYYKLALEEGATLVTGGGVPQLNSPFDKGAFIQPTIWIGLKETTRCVKEEIFGPVCHIQPFEEEEEAIQMANHSSYGLSASIWTNDLSKAHRVAKQLETGIVWVNSWFLRDLRTPFGGVKMSGIGREGGMHSLQFFSELQNICVKL